MKDTCHAAQLSHFGGEPIATTSAKRVSGPEFDRDYPIMSGRTRKKTGRAFGHVGTLCETAQGTLQGFPHILSTLPSSVVNAVSTCIGAG